MTKKYLPKFMAVMVGVAMLTACQSVSPSANVMHSGAASNAGSSAKAELQRVIKSQLRSNFSYDSQVLLSNQSYLDTLNEKQAQDKLAVGNDKLTYCESEHTHGYKALLDKASAAGLDISADYYINDKAVLQTAYLDCIAERERYYPTNGAIKRTSATEFFSEPENHKRLIRHQKSMSAEDFKESFESYQTGASSFSEWAGADGEYLPNVDTRYTHDNLQQAKVVHQYIATPTKLSMTGSYRPLQGMISLLPTFLYEQKNLSIMVNQPIYLDIKNGTLYLWADNLALVNSKLVDDKLGLGWQNKWLALPINDGTLPSGFYKDFVESFVHAQKTVFDDKDVANFNFITSETLLNQKSVQGISPDMINAIKSAHHIIVETTNSDEQTANRSRLISLWYDAMTAKYPQLKEPLPAVDKTDNIKDRLTSKALMQRLFAKLYAQINDNTAGVTDEEMDDSTANDNVVNNNDGTTNDNKAIQSTYYGIRGNTLAWVYRTDFRLDDDMPSALSLKNCSAKEVLLELKSGCLEQTSQGDELNLQTAVFTTFNPTPLAVDFARLPSHANIPTKDNSVNVLDYGQALFGRLKDEQSSTAQLLMLILLGGDGDTAKSDETDGKEAETAADAAAAEKAAAAAMARPIHHKK